MRFDNYLMAESLTRYFENQHNIEVINASDAPKKTFEDVSSTADILIFDVRKHSLRPLKPVMQCLLTHEPVKPYVVVISPGLSDLQIKKLIKSGCRGIIGEKTKLSSLKYILGIIMSGERYFQENNWSEQSNSYNLNDREFEVLELVSKGLSNREIACEIGLREVTVKFHLKSLFSKVEAFNRTHLVIKALAEGLVEFPDLEF